MKSIVSQIYIKVLAILLVSILLTPIIGHTVYAHEIYSNSTIEFGNIRKKMIVGEKQSLSILLLFDNKVIEKSNKKVQYKSNNPMVVKVENDKIIAINKGIATITAYYENKECNVVIKVFKAKELEEETLKVSLKWTRKKDRVSLDWTKFDEFVEFRILKKEINEKEYTEIIKNGVGTSFLDEDILPNHEYLYKVFLKGKNKEEYALNDVNIPVYFDPNVKVEKVEKLTEETVEENSPHDLKEKEPIIVLNEGSSVNESNKEFTDSKEKVIEKDNKYDEEVKEKIDSSKELNLNKKIPNETVKEDVAPTTTTVNKEDTPKDATINKVEQKTNKIESTLLAKMMVIVGTVLVIVGAVVAIKIKKKN
ncbi:hypothetical protein [Clostridium tarantellae]|uniref:Uncharacterized protein n=1 Tax=Clostridium tarantellae TaxID=39493 RepID=A0A6I1MMK6_9CLOT|nr:hypothetical protein [Clostridium tarantellae]MPQ44726.1 hypothetical protein [Clostridium tarantellae]